MTKAKTKTKAKARRVKKRRVTRHKGGYGIMPRLFGSNTDRSTTYQILIRLTLEEFDMFYQFINAAQMPVEKDQFVQEYMKRKNTYSIEWFDWFKGNLDKWLQWRGGENSDMLTTKKTIMAREVGSDSSDLPSLDTLPIQPIASVVPYPALKG